MVLAQKMRTRRAAVYPYFSAHVRPHVAELWRLPLNGIAAAALSPAAAVHSSRERCHPRALKPLHGFGHTLISISECLAGEVGLMRQ
jgi:hypothetical protein